MSAADVALRWDELDGISEPPLATAGVGRADDAGPRVILSGTRPTRHNLIPRAKAAVTGRYCAERRAAAAIGRRPARLLGFRTFPAAAAH